MMVRRGERVSGLIWERWGWIWDIMGTYIFFFLLFLILIPPLHSNLFSTFITPWADQSAAHTVEPDFHLPACYNVHPPAPGPAKVAAFSDETLFFMFYSSPRDALQEVAAQEL
jgi:hypothetical protein